MGLVGSILGFGGQRAAKQTNKAEEKRIQAALGELTPEAMQKLISMFYTHYFTQMMPQMMGAQQNLAAGLGRSGMTGAGVAQQLKAGIPGQFSANALNQAFGSAYPIAKSRADIQAGKRYEPVPTNWNEQMRTAANFFSGFFGGGSPSQGQNWTGGFGG